MSLFRLPKKNDGGPAKLGPAGTKPLLVTNTTFLPLPLLVPAGKKKKDGAAPLLGAAGGTGAGLGAGNNPGKLNGIVPPLVTILTLLPVPLLLVPLLPGLGRKNDGGNPGGLNGIVPPTVTILTLPGRPLRVDGRKNDGGNPGGLNGIVPPIVTILTLPGRLLRVDGRKNDGGNPGGLNGIVPPPRVTILIVPVPLLRVPAGRGRGPGRSRGGKKGGKNDGLLVLPLILVLAVKVRPPPTILIVPVPNVPVKACRFRRPLRGLGTGTCTNNIEY